MRTILNISVPEKIALNIKKQAKRAGFSSVSSYVRSIFEEQADLISESEILEMAKEADKEYASGKMKSYNSLRELIK